MACELTPPVVRCVFCFKWESYGDPSMVLLPDESGLGVVYSHKECVPVGFQY